MFRFRLRLSGLAGAPRLVLRTPPPMRPPLPCAFATCAPLQHRGVSKYRDPSVQRPTPAPPAPDDAEGLAKLAAKKERRKAYQKEYYKRYYTDPEKREQRRAYMQQGYRRKYYLDHQEAITARARARTSRATAVRKGLVEAADIARFVEQRETAYQAKRARQEP